MFCLLAKTRAGRRGSTPARGAGTGLGIRTGRGREYSLCGSAPHHRVPGIVPVPLLDQELSRKCYIHRTQQRFNTTLYTQNQYMLTK